MICSRGNESTKCIETSSSGRRTSAMICSRGNESTKCIETVVEAPYSPLRLVRGGMKARSALKLRRDGTAIREHFVRGGMKARSALKHDQPRQLGKLGSSRGNESTKCIETLCFWRRSFRLPVRGGMKARSALKLRSSSVTSDLPDKFEGE